MRVLIIDDVKDNRVLLTKLLSKYCPDVQVLGEASDIKEGEALVENHKPDLVFLDVEMPGGTGFDMLKRIGAVNFEVIFTTGHEKYALEAIRGSALDFLLKPIEPEELIRAVQGAGKKIMMHQRQKQIENLLFNVNSINADKKIALPTAAGIEFYNVSEIIRCEGDGSYTNFIISGAKKLMVSKTLSEYEDLLTGFRFFRVHKSHIINLRHIKNYLREDGGYVTMSDNSVIAISRRRKDEFLQLVAAL
jgi:two-component system, LytTR family, response regulator